MARPEPKTKRKWFRPRDSPYSKYNQEKGRHKINLNFFLTDEQYIKIICVARQHQPMHIKDFLIDHGLIAANKILEEHPELIQEVYDNPDMFHPKSGNENIFKPKIITFDIDIINKRDDDGSSTSSDTSKKEI